MYYWNLHWVALSPFLIPWETPFSSQTHWPILLPFLAASLLCLSHYVSLLLQLLPNSLSLVSRQKRGKYSECEDLIEVVVSVLPGDISANLSCLEEVIIEVIISG